jgi:hypothetical protein
MRQSSQPDLNHARRIVSRNDSIPRISFSALVIVGSLRCLACHACLEALLPYLVGVAWRVQYRAAPVSPLARGFTVAGFFQLRSSRVNSVPDSVMIALYFFVFY